SLKLGRLYRYVKLAVLGSLAAALVLNTHSLLASLQRNELSERRFLQLNKCPACWGTSWCRKFLNGQLRLESWGRLRLFDFFNVKNVYFARYGEPREGSRRVVLNPVPAERPPGPFLPRRGRRLRRAGRSRLRLWAGESRAPGKLAAEAGAKRWGLPLGLCPPRDSCVKMPAGWAEERASGSHAGQEAFLHLTRPHSLSFFLRDLVRFPGLSSSSALPCLKALTRSPSFLPFSSRQGAPCLFRSKRCKEASIPQEARRGGMLWNSLCAQTRNLCFNMLCKFLGEKFSFPSDEGWPFAKYLGACGRMVAVNYVGEELWSYFNAPWEKRVDLAWQLMEIAEQLTNNDFEFALYLLDVSFDNFAVGPRDGKVIIVDAENVLVADKRLIRQNKPENWDVWYESKFDDCDKEACLSFSKEILCARVTVDHNYYAICQNLLSRHATWRGTSGGLLHDPPAEIAKDGRLEALLDECANPKKRYGRFQAAKELREYLAQLSNNVR
ncbi:PREDICTED: deleted in autism protein 1, partial [Haliaeetus leucocephalus]